MAGTSWVKTQSNPHHQIIHQKQYYVPFFPTTQLIFSKPKTTKTHNGKTSSINLGSIRNRKRSRIITCGGAVLGTTAEFRERQKLKDLFQEAYERCHHFPTEGVSFSVHDFHHALQNYDVVSQIGIKVKGTIFKVAKEGAWVNINAKSSAILPVSEASILKIKHVGQVGIREKMQMEFLIKDQKEADDSFILSLRQIQYDLAWERCYELETENALVKGKVVGANKGGVLAMVEGLRGFVPFKEISSKSTAEELMEKELPLKILEVVKDQNRLVLSNRKAMADSQAQLGIGSVVVGTVQSLKPFGAFIDIGGMNGLLHISQISHDRVSDIATVLQPGDFLKVMILSHDRVKGRISLSTKKLEPTPGDMIRSPKFVFEKAEEMAAIFRQRIAQAEAMARSDIMRFQPESALTLNSDGSLGPLATHLPTDRPDLNEDPSAVDDSL